MYTQIKKSILIPAVTLIALTVITGALITLRMFYNNHHYMITYAPVEYEESAEPLSNPYQGWYHMYGYILSDDIPVTPETIQSNIETSENDGHQLALLEINLYNYPETELSAQALSQLESILSAWEQTSIHMIIRFVYDWSGNAQYTEPQSQSLILRHMDQTAEVVNNHAAGIYIMQGIFIGDFGEMHGSKYLSNSDIRTFAEHLASVIDPSIYLSVRTPQHWRLITESFDPLTAETAWNGSLSARLGLFNDGMLGSETDLSTYSDSKENTLPAAKTAADYSVKGNRTEELDFQNMLCNYVPNGGETVVNNSYNNFHAAVTSLSKMHASYLNSDYDAAVLTKWKLTTYHGDDCFDGMNGLDYISRHLGSRYTITSSALTYSVRGKDPAVLNLTIANNGFSSSYRPLTPEITLLNTDINRIWTVPIESDARLWAAGTSITLNTALDVPSYEPGNYTVYFKLTDDISGRQIQLANTMEADSSYGYPIASLQISK